MSRKASAVNGLRAESRPDQAKLMHARYYTTPSSRFLSPDLLPGQNLFLYAGGNPIAFLDPTGFEETHFNTFADGLASMAEMGQDPHHSSLLPSLTAAMHSRFDPDSGTSTMTGTPGVPFMRGGSGLRAGSGDSDGDIECKPPQCVIEIVTEKDRGSIPIDQPLDMSGAPWRLQPGQQRAPSPARGLGQRVQIPAPRALPPRVFVLSHYLEVTWKSPKLVGFFHALSRIGGVLGFGEGGPFRVPIVIVSPCMFDPLRPGCSSEEAPESPTMI